uniref:Centromere protein S n=1 Tax=Timema cristinae TaxID=61476 RepID=A0A7R9DF41_TIMCR|nr:unnamed protein product [Timema cristinae]
MDNLSHEQKLRVTIYIEVRKICLEAANKTNKNLDKEALDLIAELVWKKLRTLSQDLEHFAKEHILLDCRRSKARGSTLAPVRLEMTPMRRTSTRHPSTSSARDDTNEADPTRHPSTSSAQNRPNEEETTNEVFDS